ncbi:MAG: RHS repeat-associated core domain-containing protein, partial [Phycisphaerales bacterium]
RDVRGEYLFTQKERDRESGLNYFGARHMSGVLGRFLCPDPRYVEGNEHADAIAAAPQMLNLYAYAGNSPVQYTDPTGLDKLSVRGFLETALEVQSVLIGTHPVYEKAVSIALNNPIDKPATEAIDGVLGTVHSGLTKLEKAYDDHVGPVNNPVTQVKSMVPKSRAEAAWQLLMAVTTGGAAKAGQARQAAAQKLKQELARPVTVYKPLSTVKVHTKVASQTALSKTHHASPPCLADTMPAWRGQRLSQIKNVHKMRARTEAINEALAEMGLEPVRTARYGTQRGQPIETMAEWGRRNMKRVLNVWKEADEVFGAMNIENPFRR